MSISNNFPTIVFKIRPMSKRIKAQTKQDTSNNENKLSIPTPSNSIGVARNPLVIITSDDNPDNSEKGMSYLPITITLLITYCL